MISTVLALMVLGQGGKADHAISNFWGDPASFCVLKDKEIDESSGIAVSRRSSGVFYTHNDSGDTARFFRFDRHGTVTGVFNLKGVTATDWEDMDTAKVDGKPWVYLGDIGDNKSKRMEIYIYKVLEPTGPGRDLSTFETYTLTYPDGAHNCETLMVYPKTGDIYLVTKGAKSTVYKLPKPSGSGHFVLQKLGDLNFKMDGLGGTLTTGGDFDPKGNRAIVRTYAGAMEFMVPAKVDDWFKGPKVLVTLAAEMQGEGICYTGDGRGLLTTSEGSPCPVSIVPAVYQKEGADVFHAGGRIKK